MPPSGIRPQKTGLFEKINKKKKTNHNLKCFFINWIMPQKKVPNGIRPLEIDRFVCKKKKKKRPNHNLEPFFFKKKEKRKKEAWSLLWGLFNFNRKINS